MSTSTSYIGAPGTSAGFANQRQFQKDVNVYEMRKRSIFGALGKPMSGKTRGADPGDKSMDPSGSAAVLYKSITEGDTVNWSLEKVLKGAPVFGEQTPPKGGSLEFLHSEVKLNLVKSPAFQLPTEMNELRLKSTINGPIEPKVRAQIILWNASVFSHDHYKAALCGASDNLLASVADGGSNVDLGRGAGKIVSPINMIVRGTGVVGGSTLNARETAIKSAIGSLSTSTASHLISIKALHEVNEEMASGTGNFKGIDIGGQEKFVMVLPTLARPVLGSELADYVKGGQTLTPDHWLFQYRPIEIGKLMIVFDDMLAKYSPDVSGSEIIWGSTSVDPTSWEYANLTAAQKTRGVGLVMGQNALCTAQYKSMSFTMEQAPHDGPKEIASKTYRSIVRPMWKDIQDSSKLPLDQSFLAFVFAMSPLKHGAT